MFRFSLLLLICSLLLIWATERSRAMTDLGLPPTLCLGNACKSGCALAAGSVCPKVDTCSQSWAPKCPGCNCNEQYSITGAVIGCNCN